MKKWIKKALLSMCVATATLTISAATALMNVSANETIDATRFEMVDGAAIRLGSPNGLRFITELGEDIYNDLVTEEAGVQKRMGMFIVPYSYITDASKYSDGATGVAEKNYENITKKIDCLFYDSEEGVNKIYQEGDYYRANGVIANLLLQNFDREFIGLAYIAETVGGVTTYTYADFEEENDVRSAVYVAIQAYDDYADNETATKIFKEYALGAHLNGQYPGEIVTTVENGKIIYELGQDRYESLTEMADNQADGTTFSVGLGNAFSYMIVGKQASTYPTVYNGSACETEIFFNGQAVWSSSDEKIATVDKNGVVTAVGSGKATITASFMGEKTSFDVTTIEFDGTFESKSGSLSSYFTGARVQSFTAIEMNGGKVMEVQATADAYGDVCVIMPRNTISAFFADPEVQYFAFDLKLPADATTTISQILYRNTAGNGFAAYESGAYDLPPKDAFKSYYISRATYEAWIANGVTDTRILNVSRGVDNGMSLYIDNIRGVTEEERITEWYGFEFGGLRTNNSNQPLFYMPNSGAWELGISGINSATAGFTSEIVSEGNRAFQFTKVAGASRITLNHNTDTDREKELRAKGYIAYDLYVPAGSDIRLIENSSTVYRNLSQGWNTIYAKVPQVGVSVGGDASNEISRFYDTTASTYVMDNIRFLTEEEYYESVYGMEMGGGVVRTQGDAEKGTAYWYAVGSDSKKVLYSIAFTNNISDIHYDKEVVHGGESSLSFTKVGDVNLQFRADSEAYANLRNGFSFWIYSTVGINGTGTNNLINGNGQKLNNGKGINIPANTWTNIVLTKNDIVQGSGESGCKFLTIQGSTNGTYYIDDIQLLPEANTITLVDGEDSTTQLVYNGYEYSLPTPTGYTREFLGWYDESGKKIANSGLWTFGDITLTARYGDVQEIDFENGVVPSFLTRTSQTESLSVVTLNGNKVLKMQASASGTNHGLNVPLGFLDEYFADPNVAFVAFDVKSETTQHTNFRRSTIRTTGSVGSWGQEPYEADIQADNTQVMGYRPDAFKTFFFSRTDYNNWVSNNKTVEMLISAGNFAAGESLYVDNIRPVTQAQYDAANYGFETGGIRPNGGNLLVYYANTGSAWQYAITAETVAGVKPTFSYFGYTNENVTEGNRALVFTKTAGTTTMRFNNTDVANFKGIANPTGYYAFDLYVSAESDAVITYPNLANADIPGHTPNKGGWMTVYCQNNTNVCVKVTDTTGGTYMLDNFRSVTAEEYQAAQYGFEAGTMGLRLNLLNDANTNSGAAYVYFKGTDYNGVAASLSISEGNGANDVNALSNVRFDSTITHGGDFSLAFDKGNGYLAMGRHVNSQALQDFAYGFSFWIYSTTAIDGVSGSNLYNGVNGKFNNGAGVTIPANTWTQILVMPEDIGNGRFMILQGNWKSTIYIDDFEIVDLEKYTITYNADGGMIDEVTQTVYYGCEYQLKVPTYHREFLGWVDENGDPVPMSGIWEIQGDVVLTATYATPPAHYYKSEAEWEDEGVLYGLTLDKSTHTAGDGVLPSSAEHSVDMSYYKFDGEYGLNDYLVFDFTGNNMPILSFFNNSVTPTIYNHAQDASVKSWIVANGMMIGLGVPFGGYTGAHANRITIIGPNNITYKFDDNGSVALKQTRFSIGSADSPSPLAMASLNANDQYRVLVGWVESGSNMNLRLIAWNLTQGVEIVNYNQGGVAKADWKGGIALYGHFGMETYVDKVYPIVNGLDNALEMYTPDMLSYKTTWNGNSATLAAGTFTGNVSYPNADVDMSYIAFNGSYGLNDYAVFDFTGSNMPIVSFFNNTITNTIYNNNGTGSTATVKDASVTGWVWANGLYAADGSIYGGVTGAHASRLALIGKQKVIGYDQNTNGFRTNLGSASDIHPLSIRSLVDVTDTYRMIIGIGKHANASRVYVEMAAINMVTGALVYKNQWEISTAASEDGSIILYGQPGKTTVLDSVFGIEENTTLDALIAKYAKDTDYSDEAPVTLDRYGYSSITDGQWQVDGVNQETNPVDHRESQAAYDTYANAGFNIMLPQTAFGANNSNQWADTSRYMDFAANAGLKVILTDWQLQIISTPVKVTKDGAVASDSTYKPWVLASDLNSDGTGKTQAVQDYLDALALYGISVDTTRFKDRNALDSFVMRELSMYKDHSAFLGVMLGDEPSYHNMYCYGMVYQSIKRVMPECYVQYNLLPLEQNLSTIKYRYPGLKNKSSVTNAEIENAYKAYVTGFVDAMGTDYIQYDDYPFKSAEEGFLFWTETKPYVDNTSLRNIQLIAEIAKERDLDVKVVTQSSLMRSGGSDGAVHIRQITEADARWLNNYLMGFGVKQINYFTYWTKASNSSEGEWFEDGGSFVNRDGSTTAIYDFMKKIMADNTTFAPTIMNFDYNDSHVYGSNNDSNLNNDHISWSSSLTDSNYSFKWLTNVTTSKEYTLVTELFDADNYNYMYMIMNTIDTYYGGTQSVTITLDSSIKGFYVYDQYGTRTAHSGNTYTVSLTAGQAIYIMPY